MCPHQWMASVVAFTLDEEQAEGVIIIAHSWQWRSWYHILLQMECKIPLLLPCIRDLLSQCLPNKSMLYHTDLMTLRLMA